MRYVCKYHGIELRGKDLADGKRRRFYCKRCKKFKFNRDVVELDNQTFEILNQLNLMDNHLGRIWDIAFHHPIYPKMKAGIPEHNLGDLFIKLHECQRSILQWKTMSQVH